MFALIESCPEQRAEPGWSGKALSLASHVILVAAAVVATQRVADAAGPAVFVDTSIAWIPDPMQAPGGVHGGHTFLASAPSINPYVIPSPGMLPVAMPPVGDPIPNDPGLLGNDPSPGLHPGHGLTPPPGVPLDARLVDEPPEMLTHPALRYPEILRQAGIEGRVLVEAVVDTSGRAEPGSSHVVSSPNALFDAEAMAVVNGSRYRPARMDGHAVRVRVRVPITFEIRR